MATNCNVLTFGKNGIFHAVIKVEHLILGAIITILEFLWSWFDVLNQTKSTSFFYLTPGGEEAKFFFKGWAKEGTDLPTTIPIKPFISDKRGGAQPLQLFTLGLAREISFSVVSTHD